MSLRQSRWKNRHSPCCRQGSPRCREFPRTCVHARDESKVCRDQMQMAEATLSSIRAPLNPQGASPNQPSGPSPASPKRGNARVSPFITTKQMVKSAHCFSGAILQKKNSEWGGFLEVWPSSPRDQEKGLFKHRALNFELKRSC